MTASDPSRVDMDTIDRDTDAALAAWEAKYGEAVAQVHPAYQYRYAGKANTDDFAGRSHRCYELALTAVMNLATRGWETTLVHGEIGPHRNPHAWLEFRDVDGRRFCWDPTMDSVVPLSVWQKAWRGRRWSRYTSYEAGVQYLNEGHDGPWGRENDARYDRGAQRMIEAGVGKPPPGDL